MAKYITINCSEILDRAHLHQVFAEALHFPSWYGNNLDALYDCLTELDQETRIALYCWSALEEKLGQYAATARFVLTQAMEDNIDLMVEFFDHPGDVGSEK